MENSKPNFYAVIPADVRYCDNLTPNAKLLYGEITALCSKEGYCWASNQYFSELYGVHKDTISNWVSSLKDNGFITIEIVDLTSRKIYVVDRQKCLGGSVKTPRGDRQNHRHINTGITTSKKEKATAFVRFGKKGSEEAIIFSNEMDKMIECQDRKYQVIGAFMSFKEASLKPKIRTKGQLYHFCHRWIKDASILVAWNDTELNELFKKADYKYRDIDWTLNTLVKEQTK